MLSPFRMVLLDLSESYTRVILLSSVAQLRIPLDGSIAERFSSFSVSVNERSAKLSTKKPDLLRGLPAESRTNSAEVSTSSKDNEVTSSNLSTRFSRLLMSAIVNRFASSGVILTSESCRPYALCSNRKRPRVFSGVSGNWASNPASPVIFLTVPSVAITILSLRGW